MGEWFAKYRGDIFNVLGLAFSIWAFVTASRVKHALQEFRTKVRRLNVVRVLDRASGVLEVLCECKDQRFPQRYCDEVRMLLIEVVDAPSFSEEDRAMIELHHAQIRRAPENTEQSVAFLPKIHEKIGRLAATQRSGLEEIL